MKQKTSYEELVKTVQREKKKNYIILYTVTVIVWLVLVAISFLAEFFSLQEFIVNIINNLIGIIPPILIFDFFNEKLSRDASALEISNKITETLMSNPETLDLFTPEQKERFIRSTVASIAKDADVVKLVNDFNHRYLFREQNFRLRTSFDYDFELTEKLPAAFAPYITDRSHYFYVQEKLSYKIKYMTPADSNAASNYIKIGFSFNNTHLDNALRERNFGTLFENCIFRESLDVMPCDIEKLKTAMVNKETFQQLFKVGLQIDRFNGQLEDVQVNDCGAVCIFKVGHDIDALEHTIRVIFHMPKIYNSPLEVALVDPVFAPKVSLSYPEDVMQVEMFSFLSKGEESSVEVAHEKSNGIYDIAHSEDWVYPISGIVFTVIKKPELPEM